MYGYRTVILSMKMTSWSYRNIDVTSNYKRN
jgi:hypothetical protein